MSEIYLSSTFGDLKDERQAVYKALRRVRHNVIAMEDYVAKDDRPLDRCLADVRRCDLYIGIFAWRYGFIPTADNLQQKSITDLEYRAALQAGKHTLLFLLEQEAPWPPARMDAFMGEGQGARIRAFREEIIGQKSISFFREVGDLVEKVLAAVSNWEREQGEGYQTQYARNRQSYLEQMDVLYRTIKLPIGQVDDLSLQAIFQPLRLRNNPLVAEDLGRRKRRPLLGEALSPGEKEYFGSQASELRDAMQAPLLEYTVANTGNEALAKSPLGRIVVLGGPGSGKTTTLKYLIGEQVRVALDDPDAPLPIFFPLDDFTRSGRTLRQYLSQLAEELEPDGSYAEIMWEAYQDGNAFFCLDSLDEVKPEQRPKMIELINS